MTNLGVQQLHIIPFDLGCVFYDCLSINNSKNLDFAKHFIDKLTNDSKAYNFTIENNIVLKYTGKEITDIEYKKCKLAETAICIANLMPNLKCYILANGIGIFVLADLEGKALLKTDESIKDYSKAILANYQKKVTQASILKRFNGEEILSEENKAMLTFRELCWNIVNERSIKRKSVNVRKYSGSSSYKANGLSYVLSIYLLKENELTKNELNHLMRSTIFNKVVDKNEWAKINETICNLECEDNVTTLKIGDTNTYYSWSAVAVEVKQDIENFDEIAKNSVLSAMIKSELYVQSRWFIADNSMDNVNKNSHCSLEGLQRLASFVEFSQAELENDISANMNSLYKKVLNQVVITSEVRQLYKSVANQINTQKKIKEAHYQDKKRKNKLIADLFLAVFSASTLYKTVMDLISGKFDWYNWLIFAAMLVIAVGTIIFNYKNK